jgi:hypothetical protein
MKLFDKETQAALEALDCRITTMPDRYETVFMPGEVGTMTFITEAEAPAEMRAAVTKRALEVVRLSSRIYKVTTDQNLSDEGKRAMRRTLDTDRAKIAARLDSDAEQAEGVAVLAKIAELQLYEAPAVELGDFATAMDDRDVRAYFESRSPSQVGAALADMTHRQLEGLKRSAVPLPEPLQQMIDAAWEEHLQRDKSREFQTVQDDLAAARFIVGSVAQLQQAVARLTFREPGDVIRPAQEAA